jgi:hypothetical protein
LTKTAPIISNPFARSPCAYRHKPRYNGAIISSAPCFEGQTAVTNPQDKIRAYYVARLKDKNPQVRLQSIQELIALADQEVLALLQQMYETDSDEAVRKAAQAAGREVFLRLNKR